MYLCMVKLCLYKLDEETGHHTKVKLAGHTCFIKKCAYTVEKGHVVSCASIIISLASVFMGRKSFRAGAN